MTTEDILLLFECGLLEEGEERGEFYLTHAGRVLFEHCRRVLELEAAKEEA